MTRLESIISNTPPVRGIRNWAKDVYLPGSGHMSVYDVSRFFFKEVRNNKLNVRCAAVTYNLLMAIPPTLLFLFSLVPYLPLRNVQDTILATVRMMTPNNNAYINISTIIIDFMNKEQTGVLSFGIFLTIFYASNGMMGLIRSFEKATPIYIQRSAIRKRLTAIKLTFLLMGVALLSLAVLIIQTESLNGLILSVFDNTVVLRVLSIVIVSFIILVAISVIYTYGPSLKYKMKFFSPGSVFATILTILATTVFYFLVNNFINYNKVYGSIGTIMAFMVWIWLNTMVILLGYELNVSIILAKNANKLDAELPMGNA
jgi:membrane protein